MSPNDKDNDDLIKVGDSGSKKADSNNDSHLLSSGDELSLPDAKEPAVLRDSYVSKHSEEESKQNQ